MTRFISLTTDFGLQDGYVACMKGVIYRINPHAIIIDITHQISPQAIRQAAFVLANTVPYFPLATIHGVVVDPGVGSERRILASTTELGTFVAPDNGVLSLILSSSAENVVYHITETAYFLSEVSYTFHGRDVFAPIMAHLSMGVSPAKMGIPIKDYVTFLPHVPQKQDHQIRGEVIYIDHFGNCITNISADFVAEDVSYWIRIGGLSIPLVKTYSDVPPQQLLALVGSSNYLEIAVRDGNACQQLNLVNGAEIALVETNEC